MRLHAHTHASKTLTTHKTTNLQKILSQKPSILQNVFLHHTLAFLSMFGHIIITKKKSYSSVALSAILQSGLY